MDAKMRLQSYLDYLFESAPRTRAAFDLREELLANSLDKYNDLLAQGESEEGAFQNVTGSMGNVQELIAQLEPADEIDPYVEQMVSKEKRQMSAIIKAASVGLYILAGMILIFGTMVATNPAPWWLGALALCIVPTVMLVYNSSMYPKYNKKEDTVVENFKKWSNDDKRRKAVRNNLSGIMWIVIVMLYFLISFSSGAWHITWIIFLIGACIEMVINLIYQMKGK
ncbi:MAG: permease prefix domain 1-containing protein [Oscillospiraceae bacterium]